MPKSPCGQSPIWQYHKIGKRKEKKEKLQVEVSIVKMGQNLEEEEKAKNRKRKRNKPYCRALESRFLIDEKLIDENRMKLIFIYDFRSRQGLCVSGHKKKALLSVGAAAIGCSSGHCRCSPFTWVFSSFRRLLLYVSSSPSSALSVELSVSFWGEEMPKNKGKGGKNRKRGKNEAEDEKRELVFKEDGQEYAQVLRMLGNGRCEALCIDGTKRLCHIRGKMHKKVWIASGDIILVGLRDYQDDKADVILKYQPDEARLLKAYGELPENVRLNEGIAGGMDEEEDGGGDDYIEFEDEDIDRI